MKTAIITGASNGIGHQTAIGLAKKKIDLILVARNLTRLESIKNQLEQTYNIKCMIYAYDLSLIESNIKFYNDVIKKYDVDILIHGHTHRPNIHQIDIEGKSVQRIVLGDWYKSAYFYIYDNGKNIIHKQNLGIKKDHNS